MLKYPFLNKKNNPGKLKKFPGTVPQSCVPKFLVPQIWVPVPPPPHPRFFNFESRSRIPDFLILRPGPSPGFLAGSRKSRLSLLSRWSQILDFNPYITESWLKDFSGFLEPLRHARIFDEFPLYKTEFLDLKGRLGKSDFVSRNKSTTWLGVQKIG